jgi:hypothetical protein
MNIHPVGAELINTEIWTDLTKLIAAFHTFANMPKNPHFKG